MKQRKRFLSAFIAFCFIIVCLSPVESYALSNKTTTANQTLTNNKSIQSQGPDNQEDIVGKNVSNDSEDDAPDQPELDETTTGPAIDVEITQPEGNNPTNEIKADENIKNGKDEKEADKENEDLWYRKQNPMKKEHQKLLWEYCSKRKVNYIDMLALIYTESNFEEKCSTGKYHGYFQISSGNCANLAETLKTKNKPLEGTININWGTALFSWILADKRVKNLEGKKKRDVALSIYQRGTGGYDKYGINKSFLKIYYKKWNIVSGWYQKK